MTKPRVTSRPKPRKPAPVHEPEDSYYREVRHVGEDLLRLFALPPAERTGSQEDQAAAKAALAHILRALATPDNFSVRVISP